MPRVHGNFFKPEAHIGWVSALLIAVAAQGVSMYNRIGVLENALQSSTSRVDRVQNRLDRLAEHPCQKN